MAEDCPICKARKNEEIIHSGDGFFVIRAKDMKGHDERYMFCSENHVPHCYDCHGMSEAVKWGLQKMKRDFIIMFGVKASIKGHWHVIVCDRKTDGETVNIFEEPRIEVFV